MIQTRWLSEFSCLSDIPDFTLGDNKQILFWLKTHFYLIFQYIHENSNYSVVPI